MPDPTTTLPVAAAGARPRALQHIAEPLSVVLARHGLSSVGPDITIDALRPLSGIAGDLEGRGVLTYLSSARFASGLAGVTGVAVLTTEALAPLVPPGLSIVLTTDPPRDAFYAILGDAVRQGRYQRLPSRISPGARIARTATVEENVVVEEGASIGHGAVVLSNTYVGRDVVVKPNATIGGDGFETASPGGRRIVVPHAGGVWLAEGVEIGSSTCIDKGLFGDFSYLGAGTKVDNLVHFAHSAVTGPDCSLVACCEISGSVVLGGGVWVGPHVAINQGLRIGDCSYIGTGAIVTRHLPPHSLAYGSPAKIMAKVCACRSKLTFIGDRADCTNCGKQYRLVDDEVQLV